MNDIGQDPPTWNAATTWSNDFLAIDAELTRRDEPSTGVTIKGIRPGRIYVPPDGFGVLVGDGAATIPALSEELFEWTVISCLRVVCSIEQGPGIVRGVGGGVDKVLATRKGRVEVQTREDARKGEITGCDPGNPGFDGRGRYECRVGEKEEQHGAVNGEAKDGNGTNGHLLPA